MFSNRIAVSVERQPDTGREGRAVDVIGQAAHTNRTAAANRQIENLLGNFRHTVENGASSGQHDSGVETLFIARAPDFVPDEMENFFGARLKDFGEDAAR